MNPRRILTQHSCLICTLSWSHVGDIENPAQRPFYLGAVERACSHMRWECIQQAREERTRMCFGEKGDTKWQGQSWGAWPQTRCKLCVSPPLECYLRWAFLLGDAMHNASAVKSRIWRLRLDDVRPVSAFDVWQHWLMLWKRDLTSAASLWTLACVTQ